ncbi:MAG: hypothetical protein L0Y58_24735 [Verrucomicrobia subdivision 3 bacterium]|nr:hypothetical protein [Gemmataceae bacterium]MCI0748629.1 hypothetical protein [Limisphaerales bacterium]
MNKKPTHLTLKGETIPLNRLDRKEKEFLQELTALFRTKPDWTEFGNVWPKRIAALYQPRGLSRKEVSQTPLFRLAQDLGSRLAVIQGYARLPDYRDQLETLIREKFKTQRAFCKATGLGEDLVSHVLAGRKHLALDTLSRALERIGIGLRLFERQEILST